MLSDNPALEKQKKLIKFIEEPIVIDDEKVSDAFSYHHIQRCETESTVIECKGYQAFVERTASKNFITLRRIAVDNANAMTRTTGEKIHISLVNEDDNIAKAWDIFKKHAINHSISLTKVVVDSMRDELAMNDQQRGKEITIYVFNEKRNIVQWTQFLTDVTKEFITENIKPGEIAPSDKPIAGSNYFSFRNDKYISYKKSSPENKPADAKIDIQEQNLIPANNVNTVQAVYQAVNTESDEEYEINYDSTSSEEAKAQQYSSQFSSIKIVLNNQKDRVACSPCCKKCIIS